MKAEIGDYFYALGSDEFGKVIGYLDKKPSGGLPKQLGKSWDKAKFVVLALAKHAGEEEQSEDFAVIDRKEYEKLVEGKKLRKLTFENISRIFPAKAGQSIQPQAQAVEPKKKAAKKSKKAATNEIKRAG